jgi:hypothetical protein
MQRQDDNSGLNETSLLCLAYMEISTFKSNGFTGFRWNKLASIFSFLEDNECKHEYYVCSTYDGYEATWFPQAGSSNKIFMATARENRESRHG